MPPIKDKVGIFLPNPIPIMQSAAHASINPAKTIVFLPNLLMIGKDNIPDVNTVKLMSIGARRASSLSKEFPNIS
jgi:hypothetical protein